MTDKEQTDGVTAKAPPKQWDEIGFDSVLLLIFSQYVLKTNNTTLKVVKFQTLF